MRLLLVAEQLRRPVPGGIGVYVNGLVAGLQAGDAPPEVTLLASRSPASSDPLASLGVVRASRLPGPALTRAWDVGVLRAASGFDIVHAASLAAPRPAGAPLVVAVHDLAWRDVPDAFPRRGRRWHEAALHRAQARATTIVVPSEATAEIIRTSGRGRADIRILWPMYGSDHLPPADTDGVEELLGRLGVTGEFLLSVGTLEPRKNLGRLFDAYARARPRLPEPWPLVVAGPPGWGPEAPAPPGVVLAGETSPAVRAGLYARARCVAYVPLREGFGLPAVEAMRASTPVVASPMPSIGDAAEVVDPLDAESIERGLLRVATDESRRVELVAAGRLRTDGLTWAAAAAAHLELWRSLT